MKRTPKLQSAHEALSRMFCDTSVSKVETLDNLRSIREECDILMDTIRQDIKAESKEEAP